MYVPIFVCRETPFKMLSPIDIHKYREIVSAKLENKVFHLIKTWIQPF